MLTKMAESDGQNDFDEAFELFLDPDREWKQGEEKEIDFVALKKVAVELGEDMTDEELQEMLDGASKQRVVNSKPRVGYVDKKNFFSILQTNK